MPREKFNFKGVVMSDDLDSHATMRNCSIEDVAIEALNAGSDYLLLPSVDYRHYNVYAIYDDKKEALIKWDEEVSCILENENQ